METAEFSCYANGLRKSKNSELYIYDGKNILAEIDSTDIRLNIYGNALLFTIQGTITTENEVTFVDGKIAYAYEFNLHGDVVKVLGIAGIVLNTYTYDAFGVITSQSTTVANTFYYAGYQYDDETGLYYLRSSYYNAETARFITEDGFKGYYDDPLSLNRYTYCHNSPIIYFDPDGFDSTGWWLWAAAAAIVVACVVLTVVSAGGFAPAATAISYAAVNTVVVGATLTTTVCATQQLGRELVWQQ